MSQVFLKGGKDLYQSSGIICVTKGRRSIIGLLDDSDPNSSAL